MISIAGTGSADGDNNPSKGFHDFVDGLEGVRANTQINLNDDSKNLNQVKQDIKEKVQQKLDQSPKQKVLVIAHSLGGVLANNLQEELGDCVEIVPIDPPTHHGACNFPGSAFFSKYCNEIKNSRPGLEDN